MHDLEFDHMHVAPGDEVNEVAWAADNVELTTVGIDIGSSTSHLMFAQVHLQRLGTALSSRFVVVNRRNEAVGLISVDDLALHPETKRLAAEIAQQKHH